MVTLDVVLSPISKFHGYFRSGWGGGGGLAWFLWEAYGIFKFTTAFYSCFLSRLTFVLICV